MSEFLHLLYCTVIVLTIPACIGVVIYVGHRAMQSFEKGQLDRSSQRIQARHEQMRLRHPIDEQ